MAHIVKYQVNGRKYEDTFIGGGPSKIEKALLEISGTVQIESIEPTKLTEDEIADTHNHLEMEGLPVEIYRPKA